jgi:hypothetical protein
MSVLAPGVYVQELSGLRTIEAVPTSVAAFLGLAPDATAHLGELVAVNNWSQFCTEFASGDNVVGTNLSHAVGGFFANGGSRCFIVNLADKDALAGTDLPRTGLRLLEENDEISIVAAPGRTDVASHEALASHCELLGDRICILDLPNVKNTELLKTVESLDLAPVGKDKDKDKDPDAGTTNATGDSSAVFTKPCRPRVSPGGYSVTYFPNIVAINPLNPSGPPVVISPSGHMAGVMARVDSKRGVHKAPANVPIAGVLDLKYRVTSSEQADLNSKGINCIRFFSNDGVLVWGARTLAEESSDMRYVNVRRLVIMIEQSIKRNTRWVVFENNDRTTHKTVASVCRNFLRGCYRDGALVGASEEEAFFVKCDDETNPPDSVDSGKLVCLIGLAPVKPAEFIIFKIGQTSANSQVEVL